MKKIFTLLFICSLATTIFSQAYLLNVEGNAKIDGRLTLGSGTDTSNVFIGKSAGVLNSTGTGNTFLGEDTGSANTIGSSNTFVGENAGKANVDNNSNTFVGNNAGATSFGGSKNTFIGQDAGFGNTLGDLNTFLGENAGKANTTGDNNTFLGQSAVSTSTTGDNNTAVGAVINFSATNLVNSIALGYGAVMDASNKVVVGNTAITSIGGFSSWTTFPSDGRLKSKVKENVGGLDFILQLRPVTYTVDALTIAKKLYPAPADTILTGSFLQALKEKSKKIQTGFIAQEVEATAKKHKFAFSGVVPPVDEKGTYGLNYAEFTVPLVKAVQEFHQTYTADYETLETAYQTLKEEKEVLQEEVAVLRAMVQKIQEQLNGKTTTKSTTKSTTTTSYLAPNTPNPFSNQTTIKYFIPTNSNSAQLHISTIDGKLARSISIKEKGAGELQLQKNNFTQGTYIYNLEVDGKIVAGHKMIIK